jgi:hypothetical protein
MKETEPEGCHKQCVTVALPTQPRLQKDGYIGVPLSLGVKKSCYAASAFVVWPDSASAGGSVATGYPGAGG